MERPDRFPAHHLVRSLPSFFVHVVSCLLNDKISSKSWGLWICERHLWVAYTGKTVIITGLVLGSRTFLVV